jgi:hypothetical protein
LRFLVEPFWCMPSIINLSRAREPSDDLGLALISDYRSKEV